VRASIGVAVSDGATDRAALLRHADAAMYRAKATGRGAMLFAAEEISSSAQNVRLAGELRSAVDTEELFLPYQPKAELASSSTA
jgi:predicted signal transduction protein with EAL and GGDEF domain